MTQLQMNYFITTYNLGNISAASEALYVSRSVVSRAIGELEDEFGVPLFVRSANGVTPTKGGTIVYNLIVSTTNNYNLTLNRLKDFQTFESQDTIRIGSHSCSSKRIYNNIISGYAAAHPDVNLKILEGIVEISKEELLKGDLDVCFLPQRLEGPDFLGYVPVFDYQIMLGVSEKNPLAKRKMLDVVDMLDLPIGVRESKIPNYNVIEASFAAYGKKLRIVARTSSMPLLEQLTRDGFCCTFLPYDVMENWEGVVCVPVCFFSRNTSYMIWNKAIPHSKVFSEFIEYVTEKSRTRYGDDFISDLRKSSVL